MGTTAKDYHDKTSYERHKISPHFLDWQNQPSVYKSYPGIESIGLPTRPKIPRIKLRDLLQDRSPETGERQIDIEALSSILLLTYSITGVARHGGQEFYFRSVASAGALYPCEIYVAVQEIKGLDHGLYHFSIRSHGLNRLRKEALNGWANSLIAPSESSTPFLIFFVSAIFFRSSWKYRDRGYRYCLLDTGHVLENLALALKAWGLRFQISYDFDDREINKFLGVDESREVVLAACRVWASAPESRTQGEIDGKRDIHPDDLSDLLKHSSRVSAAEKEYPLILDMHWSSSWSSVPTLSPCTQWETSAQPSSWLPVDPSLPWPRDMSLEETILRRRSKRNFISTRTDRANLMAILASLSESSGAPYRNCLRIHFLLGEVEDHEPGHYLLDRSQLRYGLINSGHFTRTMASICLDQMWLSMAAFHFMFITDLEHLDRTIGPRGYRYAMLEAGRLGERIYLVSTALGMGCCGIGAYYDGEAAQLLDLPAAERLLYLVASGPIKK